MDDSSRLAGAAPEVSAPGPLRVAHATMATDLAGVVLRANPEAQALYGLPRADLVGRNIGGVVLPRSWSVRPVLALVTSGASWSGTVTAPARGGVPVRVEVTGRGIRQDDWVVEVAWDIREVGPVDPEDGLIRRLSSMVESSADAITGLDIEGRIASWNPACEQMYGWTAEEVLGRSIYELVPDDQADGLHELLGAVAAGKRVRPRQAGGLRKDGAEFVTELRVSRTVARDGSVIGFSGIARDVSERLALQRAAEADRARLAAAQALAHVGSCEIDLVTGTRTWSAEAWRIFGLEPEPQLSFEGFLAVVHPDDRAQAQANFERLRAGVSPPVQELRLVRPNGEVRWVREVLALDTTEPTRTALGTTQDITRLRVADAERRSAEASMRQSFERSALGMITTDLEGHVTMANSAFLAIVGQPLERVIGVRSADFMLADEDPALVTPRETMLAEGPLSFTAQHRMRRADGEIVWVEKTASLVLDDGGAPALFAVQLQDITARRQAELELEHRAFHDPLTGLPNRDLLVDRIEQALARVQRNPETVAVVFLDIDEFKVINDGLGHAAGDALLIQVARRLQAAVRPRDTLARFGGDEFVLVCEGIAPADVDGLGERIHDAMREPFALEGREVQVTVSAGVAAGGAGSDAHSLLRDADSAMYQAKGRGRARTVLFDATMHALAAERLDIAVALGNGLDRDELRMHYQPVLDLDGLRVVGVEALLRWEHPDRGLLHPADFVELAEQAGAMVPVGRWVLRHVGAQLAYWRATLPGASELWVAVNVSARQLADPDLCADLSRFLDEVGLPPSALRLETTESVVMAQGHATVDTLLALRELGVRVSIDDFGTGYSCLAALKQLPVDTLKVDRSFISGLDAAGSDDRPIVAAVVGLAAALALEVVAEGVETHEQLAELRRLGVRTGQGELWARAMPAPDLETWWSARTLDVD
ncbi:MAG: EAL domain-containing protein [Mycobacteriaceae bacterium]